MKKTIFKLSPGQLFSFCQANTKPSYEFLRKVGNIAFYRAIGTQTEFRVKQDLSVKLFF